MKKLVLFTFLALSQIILGQNFQKPSQAEIETLPHWALLMYNESPNVFEVDAAYQDYYRNNLFEKSYHTQYYKRWRRYVEPYIQVNGTFILPSDEELAAQREELLINHNALQKSGTWTLHGPIVTYNTGGEIVSQQANIYSLDQAPSNANILYCGTEPGEIYKSTDGGDNWFNVSLDDPLSGGVNAIKIHPTNPDIVLAGSGNSIYKTTDGGMTWTSVLIGVLRSNEIQFVPSNPLIVFAATNGGFYKSTDGGDNWTNMYGQPTYDVKINTADDNTIYIVKKDAVEDRCEFFMSTDMGATFNQQSAGFFTSSDPDMHCGGARIAVTDADANRVYVYLIGEAKTGDTGFIGVYRSDDGGVNWNLPNPPAGGPYDANHANLAIGTETWQYHQGFYNCALMASNTNADEILLGGLNLYKSDDGGATFYPLAGYVGGPYSMHVDMQDFRAFGTTYWITTDGGIYKSTDFFNSSAFQSKMYGIHSSDYWGFGQGWNQDVTVGGLYHNGNMSSYENWPTDEFLQLGGGEPASGYVNPGENRRVYSSDINGKIIPQNIGDPVTNVGFGIDPNESYWTVNSTELEFDPRCYSIAFTGVDNELWRTDDMGITFNLVHTFGTDLDDRVTYIEIAWSNPDVIYACQQITGTSEGKLWKSTDGGMSWSETNLPSAPNTRRMLVQVSPEDENEIWVAFAHNQSQRIFHSTNGGDSWTDLSSSMLNGQEVRSIAVAGGTDGGIYYATNQTIYYRNNSMSDWEDFGDGLPISINTNIIRPFYRDGKIRMASYGKGIWESPLYEPQAHPIAQIQVDKMGYTMHCEVDTFYYVDHSMLNHSSATWNWTFQGGTPASSTDWNEAVTYDAPGTYLTILEVTDGNGMSDVDSLYITIEAYEPAFVVSEDFEGTFIPEGWEIKNPDEGQTWELTTDAGAFGNSSQAMIMRGFDYWPGGDEDDIRFSINMTSYNESWFTFDVAYARYAVNYSDSLEVLVSTDCGASYTSMYYKGGSDLATAPDNNQFYIPAPTEWRTDSIDVSAFAGNTDVMFVFRSHTGWGNNVYVDNVNLSGIDYTVTEENPELNLSLYPNPACAGTTLQLNSNADGPLWVTLYSADGRMIYRKLHQPIDQIDLLDFAAGSYIYVIKSSTAIKKGVLIMQ